MLEEEMGLQVHLEELIRQRMAAVNERHVRRARAVSLQEELNQFLSEGNKQLQFLLAEIESVNVSIKQVGSDP